MEDIKKHQHLLLIIAVLVAIKFILIPVVEWQNNEMSEIRLLEKKAQKLSSVVTGQDKYKNLMQQLKEESDLIKQVTYNAPEDLSLFKIERQKWFEEKLKKFNLKLNNFGWEKEEIIDAANLTKYPVSLQFEGRTKDVLDFILMLEQNDKMLFITEFMVGIKKQRKQNKGIMSTRLTLTLFLNNKNGN